LSNYLLDRVANTLRSLEVTLPNFVVIDTRGTLCSARPETTRGCGDWQNEIHPSRAGYRKLAPVVASVIDRHLHRSAAHPCGADVSSPLSDDESRFSPDYGGMAGFLRRLRMQP